MASAAFATHNELNWGQSGGGGGAGFMVNTPSSKTKQFQSYSSSQLSTDSQDQMPTTSEDAAHSFNQRSKYANADSTNNNHGDYVRYDINSFSRTELVELKKRLTLELEQIKALHARIESGSFHPRLSLLDDPQFPPAKTMTTTTKKKHSGKKRPIPFHSSANDPKRVCWNGFDYNNDIGDLMKKSRQILTTLMKHKHSWVFKEPVDALSLGLHDYHHIVKHPMDLGTVKANFSKNAYATPMDFAEDVRLTFNNAILYNPKTDKVHAWAGELLARFEDLFRPIQEKMGGGLSREDHQPPVSSANDDLQKNLWNHIPTPEIERAKKSTPSLIPPTISKKQPEKPQQMPKNVMKPSTSSQPLVQSSPSPPPPPKQQQQQQRMASPISVPMTTTIKSKANSGKLPKPKAKDVDKREMSMEEKDRLSMGLQNLPQEKMPQLIHIIRKRNSHLAQVEDEIELDMETLDTETLWELDRFVTNWKKMVSKTKRQALMANNVNMVGGATTTTVIGSASLSLEENMVVSKAGKKGGEGGEEDDVDIGVDEMAMMNSFPPVEIEKDVGGGACPEEEKDGGGGGQEGGSSSSSGNGGSSSSGSDSSSSSSSSSSSDSDSGGSSLGSDSNADEAQSGGGCESKIMSRTT